MNSTATPLISIKPIICWVVLSINFIEISLIPAFTRNTANSLFKLNALLPRLSPLSRGSGDIPFSSYYCCYYRIEGLKDKEFLSSDYYCRCSLIVYSYLWSYNYCNKINSDVTLKKLMIFATTSGLKFNEISPRMHSMSMSVYSYFGCYLSSYNTLTFTAHRFSSLMTSSSSFSL